MFPGIAKKIAIALIAMAPLVSVAQTVDDSPHTQQKTTIKKSKLNAWSNLCLRAVRAEKTLIKSIDVKSATIKTPSAGSTTATCTVNAKVAEILPGDSFRTNMFMKYEVAIDTKTKKAVVAPIGYDGALKTAQIAMAEKFMTVSPTSGSKDKYSFNAIVDGHSCVVNVDASKDGDESFWAASEITCETLEENK